MSNGIRVLGNNYGVNGTKTSEETKVKVDGDVVELIPEVLKIYLEGSFELVDNCQTFKIGREFICVFEDNHKRIITVVCGSKGEIKRVDIETEGR